MTVHSPTHRARAIAGGIAFISSIIGLSVLAGCQAHTGPYAAEVESRRDQLRAQELTDEAAKIIEAHPERAERLLRDALSADLYHGPAHNNLGVIYLKQGKLYEAAGEFEWARKLLPGHPDPRMNLAITLERAGRTEEALTTYASALEVYPGHVPSIQALSLLQIKHNRADDRTAGYLQTVALQGDTPRWRQWAQERLSKMEAGEHKASPVQSH